MAKGTFGANITSERIADLGIDSDDIADNAVVGSKILNDAITGAKLADNISITTTGTLDVSGGTLTTSTTQNDAIVDGSTAITRSSNDLTFAGNIDASSGTTNNIGTVTAGTISHTVSMTGVPKRTTIHKISQSSYRDNYTSETTQRVTHTSVSFPVLNGHTYLIQVNGLANVELSSSSSFDRGGTIRLYYHTASKSRGNSSAFGTLLQTIHIGQINDTATSGELNGEPFHMIGAFTASSNTTMYTHLTAHSSAVYHEVEIDSGGGHQEFGGELYFVIQEFDSDVLT